MSRRLARTLALVAMAVVGVLAMPTGAMAAVTKTVDWDTGVTVEVHDDGTATASGTFESYNPYDPFDSGRELHDVTSLDVSNVKLRDGKSYTLSGLFNGATELRTITGLDSWDTSHVYDMSGMFQDCGADSLDLSSWDTSDVGSMRDMFAYMRNLKSIKLGPKFSFKGRDSSSTPAVLPSSQYHVQGATGNWIREDKAYGPYDPAILSAVYTSDMAGTWVPETASTYTVHFDANGGVGSMADRTFHTDGTVDVIPSPGFYRAGYRFKDWRTMRSWNWRTGEYVLTGATYLPGQRVTVLHEATMHDGVTVDARPGDEVSLYAEWEELPSSASVHSGCLDVSLQANQQVTVQNLPAGASYTVTETPVPSGWTLVRSEATTGVIMPSVG